MVAGKGFNDVIFALKGFDGVIFTLTYSSYASSQVVMCALIEQ